MGIRGDGKALASEVGCKRGDAVTVLEHSAAGDSQGDGLINRAVKTVEEVVRALKLDVVERVSQKLNVTHRATFWLVERAVILVNEFQFGQDGKTGLERLKRTQPDEDLLRFASQVTTRTAPEWVVLVLVEEIEDEAHVIPVREAGEDGMPVTREPIDSSG